MAQTGQLVQWNDDRGFGFIDGGDGQRLFVHISAIERIATRPRIGDRVSFVRGLGQNGRPQARAVRILGANPVASPQQRQRGGEVSVRPEWRFLAVAMLLAVLAMGSLVGRLPWPLVAGYAIMGAISFVAYRLDKGFAQTRQWRISEVTLLGFDLCLGLIGGLLGQALFHHKTRKPGYVAMTALIGTVHLLWLAGLVSGQIDPAMIGEVLAPILPTGI